MLLSSIAYRQASIELRERYSNGCGPNWFPRAFRSGLGTIFGHDVREACAIHDWDYAHGYDKKVSDKRFHKNLKILSIEAAKDKRMLYARLAVSWIYYQAVRFGGVFSYGR